MPSWPGHRPATSQPGAAAACMKRKSFEPLLHRRGEGKRRRTHGACPTSKLPPRQPCRLRENSHVALPGGSPWHTQQEQNCIVVGRMSETREMHLARHRGGFKVFKECARCRWYHFEQKWKTSYGQIPPGAYGKRMGTTSWLAERPRRWGGVWGLGCHICANFLASLSDVMHDGAGKPSHERCVRAATAWARFEIRPRSLQAQLIRQHVWGDLHKRAVRAWFRPDQPLLLDLQASQVDDELLRGAVPQPADWLRAWRASRTPQSWQAAAAGHETEHYIMNIRERLWAEYAGLCFCHAAAFLCHAARFLCHALRCLRHAASFAINPAPPRG